MDAQQRLVQEIAVRYVVGYHRQKARAEEILEQMESLAGREERAQEEPELARIFESRTREERDQRVEEISIGIGVAHAVLYVLNQST